jgi:hypothetical protein
MKLFKYQMGSDEKLGVAKDSKDAYERRTEVDHTFAFLPVNISEVTLEGYQITLTPVEKKEPKKEVKKTNDQTDPKPTKDDLAKWDKPKLKEYLDANNIDYVPQWGEKKLRKAILNAE